MGYYFFEIWSFGPLCKILEGEAYIKSLLNQIHVSFHYKRVWGTYYKPQRLTQLTFKTEKFHTTSFNTVNIYFRKISRYLKSFPRGIRTTTS